MIKSDLIHFVSTKNGSSLMSTSPIKADAASPLPLVVCPKDYIIGPDLAESLFNDVWHKNLNLRQSLIKLSFLFEVLVQKNDSKWKEYLDVLPSYEEISIPTSWNSKELNWLAGTNIYNHVSQRIEMWESEWKTLQDHIPDFDWSLFSFEKYCWASAIFLSRSFPARIIYDEEKYDCEKLNLSMLLPVVDSLNHAPETAVFWDTDDNSFVFSIGYSILENSEIFNNYGPKGNEELLMGYGFCLDIFKFDLVTVKLGVPKNETIMRSLAQNSIEIQDGYFTGYLSLDSPICEELLKIFTIVAQQNEDLTLKSSSSETTRSETLNGINMLKQALTQKLHNINESECFLTEKQIAELGPISKSRYINATLYRKGQRLILENSLNACGAKSKQLLENAKFKIDVSTMFTAETEEVLKRLLDVEEDEINLLDDEDNAEVALILIVAAEFLKGDASRYKEALCAMWEIFDEVNFHQELADSFEQEIFNYVEENRRSMGTKAEILQLMAQKDWSPKVMAEAKRVVYKYGYWTRVLETSKKFLLLV